MRLLLDRNDAHYAEGDAMRVKGVICATVIALGAVTAGPASAAPTWQFANVDGCYGTGECQATYPPAMLSINGHPAMWWYHEGGGIEPADSLEHATWDGRAWHRDVVEGNGVNLPSAGARPVAVMYNGQPNLFYDAYGAHRHAWWDGTGWRFENLPGGTAAAAVVDGGTLHVFWTDGWGLGQSWRAGAVWKTSMLDGVAGSDGQIVRHGYVGYPLQVAMSGGVPHLFYYDRYNGNLRQAWYSAGRWHYVTLDGAGGSGRVNADVGDGIAVNTDGGYPHLFYYDRTNGNLRQAWFDPASWRWRYTVVDGAGTDVGADPSTAVAGTTPWVFYRDVTHGDLRAARYDPTTRRWVLTTLDGSGGGGGRVDSNVGINTAAVATPEGVFVAYYNYTDQHPILRTAWLP